MDRKAWDEDREYHKSLCVTTGSSDDRTNDVHLEEIRTTPLFSADVLARTQESQARSESSDVILPKYGYLGRVVARFDETLDTSSRQELPGDDSEDPNIAGTHPPPTMMPEDDRLMVNMNASWSVFMCGSQGSGKSHTLSCLLENALFAPRMGKLPHPLAGMVFHYDKFTGFSNTQVCEAAYLASSGIPVKVLVSPSNYRRMQRTYEKLPGIQEGQLKVVPLLLHEEQLNVGRMMKLMAVDEKDGRMALYMEVSGSSYFMANSMSKTVWLMLKVK